MASGGWSFSPSSKVYEDAMACSAASEREQEEKLRKKLKSAQVTHQQCAVVVEGHGGDGAGVLGQHKEALLGHAVPNVDEAVASAGGKRAVNRVKRCARRERAASGSAVRRDTHPGR